MLDNGLWEAAVEMQDFLQAKSIPNCIIGGLAVNRWGEPRATSNVDATLVVGFGNEHAAAATILKAYTSRVANPLEFALRARILLVVNSKGVKLDLSLGGLPFEERILQRSSPWEVESLRSIRTCSAEDLGALKAFASRPQDWIDVERIVIRQGLALNRELVATELHPLVQLKEEPEILSRLDAIFSRTPPN
jgi:hypothetical protein